MQEYSNKKQRIAEEVIRTGGVFGEMKEELERYIADERASKLSDVGSGSVGGDSSGHSGMILKAHIVVPTQEEIMNSIVEEKKAALLEKLFAN